MLESPAARVLGAVEDLAPGACGAFMLETEQGHVGSVLIEHNQVCWALTPGRQQRLIDLLRERLGPKLSRTEVETLFQRCKVESRPLGEELVAQHLVDGDVMRAALRDHTVESLLALPAGSGERVRWVAHRGCGYNSRFTFNAPDLYARLNARVWSATDSSIEAGFALLEPGILAAAYVRDGAGRPAAVKVLGDHSSVSDLVALGLWVDAALGASSGFSPEVLQRAISLAVGEVALGFRTSPDVMHAAVISDRASLWRVVSKLELCGYPAVLSRRAPRSSRSIRRDGLRAVAKGP